MPKQALQSSEERYRSLVELSPDALYVQSDDKNSFYQQRWGQNSLAQRVPSNLLINPCATWFILTIGKIVQERMRRLHCDGQGPLRSSNRSWFASMGLSWDAEVAAAPLIFERQESPHRLLLMILPSGKRAEEEIRRFKRRFGAKSD